MIEPNEDRDTALRQLLVATASADSAAVTPAASNRSPRWLVVLLAGLAMAGFGTAGAVAAVALAPSEAPAAPADPAPDAGQFVGLMTSLERYSVGSSHTAVGDPVTLQGTGTTSIDLGVPPPGASGVATAIACSGDDAEIAITVDGEEVRSFTCSADGDALGTQIQITGANPSLTVETSATFALWMTWITPVSRVSPEQAAELADGVVTEPEYRAAFERFAACMVEVGYPLQFIDDSGPVMSYSISDAAVTSGVEAECYLVEFMDVDMEWQVSQED